MVGTHQQKFRFVCPVCHAQPGKPCVWPEGPRKGKTTTAHWERWKRAKIASDPNKFRVKAVWSSQFESNRGKH
jgi:hypothetical protein